MRTARLVVGVVLLIAGGWLVIREWDTVIVPQMGLRADDRLRLGMTIEEAHAVMGRPGRKGFMYDGTPYYWDKTGKLRRMKDEVSDVYHWQDVHTEVSVIFYGLPGQLTLKSVGQRPIHPSDWLVVLAQRVGVLLPLALGVWVTAVALRRRAA